ncbi:MAG: pyrroline-5-carboxylate reductase [Calditrichaeota bacterium]|nr:pyrroline-5-carboxylate reductase [Calditrichota bacterium]
MSHSIAIIGAGRIGTALIGGLIRSRIVEPVQIVATARSEDTLSKIQSQYGIHVTTDNARAVEQSDIIILSVKPQNIREVLVEITPAIRPDQLILSVIAGITTAAIQKMIGQANPIVRAMPNIPVVVDAGATAIAAGKGVGESQLETARTIFSSVGKVVVVRESQMDAVTGLSGSGPAYIYMVIEALIDGGVKMGLSRDVATELSVQTVLGAARLMQETGKHPAVLRDDVTTPGGTAIAAIHELEEHGLRNMLISAVETASLRSQALSRLLVNGEE